jgi:hypothetical protein
LVILFLVPIKVMRLPAVDAARPPAGQKNDEAASSSAIPRD